MVATTWNRRSLWQTKDGVRYHEDRSRSVDGRAKRRTLHGVEDEDGTHVVSRAGILQRQSVLRDVVCHLSKGLLILPVVLVALLAPAAAPLLAVGEYMVLILCLCHLILVATVLTVWAMAISSIEMQQADESLEARSMTAADGDSSRDARSSEVKSRSAA